MKTVSICIALVLGCTLFSLPGLAQETQVPLDSAGTLQVIDAATARRLALFSEYQDFQEARLYQLPDSSYILEITYQENGKTLKERKPLSAPDAQQFRADVAGRMSIELPHGMLNQEGRARLLVGTTLLGLFYYGWAVPAILSVDNGKGIGALYMLTSSASFVVPYLISRNTSISNVAAGAALYGGTRGIFHGLALYGALAGSQGSTEGWIATGMGVSVAELVGGFQLANRHHWSAGKVSAIGACSDVGMVFGSAAGLLATERMSHAVQVGYDDSDKQSSDEERMRITAATFLAGAAGGMVVGNLLSDHQEYSQGDGYVLRETSLAGIGAGLALADMADGNRSAFEFALMTGSALGIAAGHRLTRDVNFTPSQGTIIGLSELGGALIGLGVAYLADARGASGYLGLGTIGGMAGFGLAYHAYSHQAQALPRHSFWNMGLSPEGLLTLDRSGAIRIVPGMRIGVQF